MIALEHVSKVHGKRAEEALRRMDLGEERRAVEKATSARVALHDVSLALDPGELVTVMGLAASGKSTLLRVMNGLVVPDRGRVLVEDEGGHVDLARASAKTRSRLRRTKVSFVFTEGSLLPWRTAAENVALGLEIRGTDPHELDRAVGEKLALVGLEGAGDLRCDALTLAQQRRVGLARALAVETPVLLLDDPFRGLDTTSRTQLQDELQRLHRVLEITMVLATSDLDEAIKLGERIVMLAEGRVAQIGTPEEIVVSPANETVRALVAHVPSIRTSRRTEAQRGSRWDLKSTQAGIRPD